MKIKKEIEELFYRPTNMSIIEMNKFEEKEMMKKRTCAWYNWLSNYISGSIKNGGQC